MHRILRIAFHTQNLLHTDAFAQKLLHTGAFTYRDFYAQTLLHTDAFTHRSFYTQKLLHTEVFATALSLQKSFNWFLLPIFWWEPQVDAEMYLKRYYRHLSSVDMVLHSFFGDCVLWFGTAAMKVDICFLLRWHVTARIDLCLLAIGMFLRCIFHAVSFCLSLPNSLLQRGWHHVGRWWGTQIRVTWGQRSGDSSGYHENMTTEVMG